jgi:hypothetical protein
MAEKYIFEKHITEKYIAEKHIAKNIWPSIEHHAFHRERYLSFEIILAPECPR